MLVRKFIVDQPAMKTQMMRILVVYILKRTSSRILDVAGRLVSILVLRFHQRMYISKFSPAPQHLTVKQQHHFIMVSSPDIAMKWIGYFQQKGYEFQPGIIALSYSRITNWPETKILKETKGLQENDINYYFRELNYEPVGRFITKEMYQKAIT